MKENIENNIEQDEEKKKKISKIIFITVSVGLFLIAALLIIFSRQLFGDQIGDMLLGKDVENGFVAMGYFFANNAANFLWSLLVLAILVFSGNLLFIIINLLCNKSARAKTIGSLLKSLTKYLLIVVGICSILGVWGVNVAAIFAGVGILALIIGLGCKSLVNDIVSGFFIVVDNYFQVGDKVTIDGFTGTVETIGLRTTKIKDWMGNLKSINNSLITTVVNLSRYDSYASVKIDISFNEDLERVEAIITNNLEYLKEKIPTILETPTYVGVTEMDDCGLALMVNAYCHEKDRVSTSRKLLRELYLLFVKNDVIIPFKQVVVNPPDSLDRPKATTKDKDDVNVYLYGTSKVKDKKSKKKDNLISVIKEASKTTGEE